VLRPDERQLLHDGFGREAGDRLFEREVGGEESHLQIRTDEHHGDVVGLESAEVGEKLGVARVAVPGEPDRRLAQRGRHDRGGGA